MATKITSADIKDSTIVTGDLAFDVATQAELDAHVNDTTDAHDASAISFSPTGSIAATDVQAAVAEVALEAGGGAIEWEDVGTTTTIDYPEVRVSSADRTVAAATGILIPSDYEIGSGFVTEIAATGVLEIT